ncbi:hydrogenase maturation protease [Pontibacillus yanchengensis]|uniref:Hydrogenase maturation protease n=1 Tax=Pontibacillus yanchengensis TaxID=462910 RepID=A0A6I5A697_9BACI|nr:hydrogenase maturation protease [Pontibacillus yanchengensis]MYL35823.1 hydrogenase maturation protease [Pontibacillus yanchengensis]
MSKIIILGIGNQLMMDDVVGIYLVQELEKANFNPDVQYIVGESDVDYGLEKVEGASCVIVIDAVYLGKEVGEVTVMSLEELPKQQTLDISPHNLHLFQALYQRKDYQKGYLIGVEPQEITFHIGLSKNLNAEWDRILEKVRGIIKELVSKEY